MNTPEYNQQYYLKNRDRIRQRQQERAEEIKKYQAEYRRKNREKINALRRNWYRDFYWLNGNGSYSGQREG